MLAVRTAPARRAVPDCEGSRRDQDRARPSCRRLHRDAASQPLLRRRAESNARKARLGRRGARRHPTAGLCGRRRGARVHEGVRPANHRLLLPGVRRSRAAASAYQAVADGNRARAPRRQELDAEGARQRRPPALARHASQSARRAAGAYTNHRVRAVVQRVSSARVEADGWSASIAKGLLALVGVERGDGPDDVEYIARKIRETRLFEDPQQPHKSFELSVHDVGGQVLVVSQFTLAADCRRGRRPAFDAAAPPEIARPMYESVVMALKQAGLRVETGRFQAMMQVSLINDGPVTLLFDSRKQF